MIKKKGFTLIELLVVIAIIGILASIVLVSLTGARKKAKDAAIQADITQVRTVAEMVYSDDLKYDALNLNTDYLSLVSDITKNGGGVPAAFASGDDYCVSATLNDGTTAICVSAAGSVGDDICIAAGTTCAP